MSYCQTLIDYSKDVLSGKIISCQKHKWACNRFLSDVERSKTDKDFPYEFVDSKAEKFERFCGMFKHTKGVLAGEKIEFTPIDKFIFGNIYGWYHKATGYRRFSKVYWQIGRKNGKSQKLSLACAYELLIFKGDEVTEIYAAATKKEQSKIVYDETVKMLRAAKEFLQEGVHYSVANGKITRLKNGSVMRPLSKEDRKTGDGLNPQLGATDEYHAHETTEILDVIESGMVARTEPLSMIITTAGFELNNPCYQIEYTLISKILNPDIPINIESYFVMVNELDRNNTSDTIEVDGKKIKAGELIDDINDESVWGKSNPIVCSYPEGVDQIRKRLELASSAPEKMRDFLTKTMNVWVNERSFGYMNMAKWGACAYDKRKNKLIFEDYINEMTKKECYVGYDLSAKIDLTSITFEFIGNDGKYYVKTHSFMPDTRFREGIKQDKVPYDLWVKQGWLTITEGDVVDYRLVKNYVLDTAKKHGWNITEHCFDPYAATQIMSDIIEDGETCVEIRQGMKTLSEPTKNFREEVYCRNVVHDGSPVTAWAMGNAVTKTAPNESIMLDKAKAKQRIDPAAAIMNSHTRAFVSGNSKSIYEQRGMRSL